MIDINYDRKEKAYKWVAPDGEILTAPSGCKHDLFKAAVAMLDDDLFTAASLWIGRTPQLERLIWRGVELVAADRLEVYDMPKGSLVALVEGSDEYGRYAIQAEEHQHTCQCMAFKEHPQYDENGRIWCKHLAAVHLWQVARADY